jgi:hypothetical protein
MKKYYIVKWDNGKEFHHEINMVADNIKDAKKYAQAYKRRNGIVGITIVKLSK